MSPPKLIDVAREAGVDVATASRALHRGKGWERLSAECVRRVTFHAEKLGYRPNAAARGLRQQRVGVVGLLLPVEQHSAFVSRLTVALQDALRQRGLHALLIAGRRPIGEAEALYQERRIDGLIAPVFSLRPIDLKALKASSIPHVLTHQTPGARRKPQSPVVILDSAKGIEQAVDLFVSLGHRSLLWAGYDPERNPDVAHRRKAFVFACQMHDLPCEEVVVPDVGSSGGVAPAIEAAKRSMLAILRDPNRPSGVVCYHDMIALGVLSAAREIGVAVPEQLSVIGFDDAWGEIADPPLTSISHAPACIAEAAVNALLDIIGRGDPGEFTAAPVVIAPEIVCRQSTGPAPDSAGSAPH